MKVFYIQAKQVHASTLQINLSLCILQYTRVLKWGVCWDALDLLTQGVGSNRC